MRSSRGIAGLAADGYKLHYPFLRDLTIVDEWSSKVPFDIATRGLFGIYLRL